jgi:hypothetical protein
MTLGDPVAESNGVHFESNPAGDPDSSFGCFRQGPQMNMARVDFRPGVDDSDERFFEIRVREAQGAEQSPVGCPGISLDKQITPLFHISNFLFTQLLEGDHAKRVTGRPCRRR